MLDNSFKPVLRFMVASDIHYHDEYGKEQERMEKALSLAYKISESSDTYKKLDAVYIVGDFANSGSEKQMTDFNETLKKGVKAGTETVLMLASHEFHGDGGEERALKQFKEIFNIPPDDHKVINGFHFISLTTTHGCNFSDEKILFAKTELEKARKDSPTKPIFFFQHPHISDTVYGSINWGEDALYSTLMDYPQIIDFSGHSHAPINDPRSIHQKHFTSLGTGSLSYFELDEFDKFYGTVPPDNGRCAQMLIVEADEAGRVRVYPYDIISENFFPYVWKIDEPSNPESFLYTDRRYKTTVAPVFKKDYSVEFSGITSSSFTVTYPQATISEDYVNDYLLILTEKGSGNIVKQAAMWSEYYFYNMPETLSHTFTDLKPGTEYELKIKSGGFWKNYTYSEKFSVKTAKEEQ